MHPPVPVRTCCEYCADQKEAWLDDVSRPVLISMAMSSRRARSETSGHGNCMEVAVPSGLRRGRPGQLQQPREHASDGEPDPRVTKVWLELDPHKSTTVATHLCS